MDSLGFYKVEIDWEMGGDSVFEDKADNFWKFVIICPQNYQLMAFEVTLKGLVKVDLTEDHANSALFF